MMAENILSTDIQFLPGVGPRRGEVLRGSGVKTFADLLRFYPRRHLDRSIVVPIRKLSDKGGAVTVVGTVVAFGMVPGRRKRFELVVGDDGGQMKCVWFNSLRWISTVFEMGEKVAFHGQPQRYGRSFSMVHPDFDKLGEEGTALDTGRIISLYPGGAKFDRVGLTSRQFRRIIHGLFKEHGREIPEILPKDIRAANRLIDGNVALRAIHFPKSHAELEEARRRLKFEEFFFMQLLLALNRKQKMAKPTGIVFEKSDALSRVFLEEVLPFELTKGQLDALADIRRDTRTGHQMNRLLQGDVGSGKTVVAVGALLLAIDSGYQAAFMAPTEILAEQHYRSIRSYLSPLDVDIRLLVGAQKKSVREEILTGLASGVTNITVGTHALIEENVRFQKLGVVVIDEQHRFGVMQRAKMFTKGVAPHVLLMTATPIPRSLAMTLYGDLDVSIMRDMPAGRRRIETWLRFENRRDEVLAFIRKELQEGRQAYVVYPLVEESEKVDLKDAVSGFETLQQELKEFSVGLVHGRMSGDEKEAAMRAFKAGDTHVLVATTVVEVGVDVANATVMMIEHAERFGLSQLHQLRGRVGRSHQQSYCILMADFKRSAEAKERLEAMVRTTDGFEISEADLRLRGAGDVFGTRQSGLPELKLADVVADQELLRKARDAAFQLAETDPHIRDERLSAMRDYFLQTAPKQLRLARVG
ncbi:MAG TPA: ATP-dependent DNA helicase RecG [Rhodothermales bacterium]